MKYFLSILILIAVMGFGYNKYLSPEPTFQQPQKEVKKGPITISLDWEITKPFQLQIFYITDPNENFNEKHSVRKNVSPKDKHVEIVIPEDKIYNFRLDFGSKPESLTITNVEITGDIYLKCTNWYNYIYVNIDKNKVHKDNNSITIIASSNDPYMMWNLPFVVYKN